MDAMGNTEGTRDRILQAAAELFAERGLKGTTIRHICARASVNLASVNYHFKTKNHLYAEVINSVCPNADKWTIPAPQSGAGDEAWQAAVKAWIERLMDWVFSENPPDSWAVKLLARERAEPSFAFHVLQERLLDPMTNALKRLIEQGLHPDTPPQRVLLCTFTGLSPCLMYSQREGEWDRLLFPEGLDRREVMRHMTDLVVTGLTAQKQTTHGAMN